MAVYYKTKKNLEKYRGKRVVWKWHNRRLSLHWIWVNPTLSQRPSPFSSISSQTLFHPFFLPLKNLKRPRKKNVQHFPNLHHLQLSTFQRLWLRSPAPLLSGIFYVFAMVCFVSNQQNSKRMDLALHLHSVFE